MKIKNRVKNLIFLSLGLLAWFMGMPRVFAAVSPPGEPEETDVSGGTELGKLEGLDGFDPGKSPEDATASLTKILSNTFGVLTLVGGIMFILYFILGGLKWVSSSGEQAKVEEAKKQMTNAAIGLIIVVASYSIAFIVGSILGVDILNPAQYILNRLRPSSK